MQNKKITKPTLVFLDTNTVDLKDIDFTRLKQSTTAQFYSDLSVDDIIKKAKQADIVITNKCVMDRKTIEQLPRLKLICVAATGVNNVDLIAAKEHKIAVCNVAGYSTHTVAEHAFLFMLALAHRFLEHDTASKNGEWSQSDSFTVLKYPFFDLRGKTLGIIGYGSIGKQVAKIARAFKMNVLIAALPNRTYKNKNRTPLKEFLKKSDFVSLHTALHQNTYHLINKNTLTYFKKGSCLINLSRGAVVDEQAVATALLKNQLTGYASDVLSSEPPPPHHPLLNSLLKQKVLLTPHIAWASHESRQRLVDEITKNIIFFLKGKSRNKIV